MKSNKLVTSIALVAALLVAAPAFSQRADGDKFTSYLGITATSPDFDNLLNSYAFDKVNDQHYLSKGGVELILEGGILTQIQIYRHSEVYGQFNGSLPRGLWFGMSQAEVRAILGRPVVAYNSTGYLEFVWRDYTYACSFDKGRLAQISVSLK